MVRTDYILRKPTSSHVLYDSLFNLYTLRLPYSHSDTARFAILHEYAHIALGHLQMGWLDSSRAMDDQEIEADRLALQWIRPSLYDKALRFYLSCVAPSGVYKHWYREELKARLSQ